MDIVRANGTPLQSLLRHGSVSERHAARLDALEAVTGRLLANEAKLIADSVTAQRNVVLVSDAVLALRDDTEQAERRLGLNDQSTSMALARFRSMSFWQRLRWLLLGVVE